MKINPVKDYINKHFHERTRIDISNIVLTESIHNNGIYNANIRVNLDNTALIVRPIGKGKFSLVFGWGTYMYAKHHKTETINCLFTDLTREEFLYKNCVIWQPIEKITVPKRFKSFAPSEEKIQNAYDYYEKYGCFDTPIIIDKCNVLKDGYARYIAADRLGISHIPTLCKER